MTTKLFCDGCDKEVSDRRQVHVTVTYEVAPVAYQPTSETPFDLCETCFNYFRFNTLPRKWPRASVSEPTA